MPSSSLTAEIVVLTTFPVDRHDSTAEAARRLASRLVEMRLAACVQILPPQISIYHWEGKVEESTECLVMIKSVQQRFAELEREIRDLHPYDVPEIIALPIVDGSPDYLHWIRTSTSLLP